MPPNFSRSWRIQGTTPRTKSGLVAYVASLWGPAVWRALHTATEVGDMTAWALIPAALSVSLPCPDCEMHYASWLRTRPAPMDDRTAARAWLLALHNDVNRRTGKPAWTSEQVAATYTDIDAAVSGLNSVASIVGPSLVAALRKALTLPTPVVEVEPTIEAAAVDTETTDDVPVLVVEDE